MTTRPSARRPSINAAAKTGSAQTPLLVVTRDAWLRERVLLLCAASGFDADVVEDLEIVQGRWRTAPAVLVDPTSWTSVDSLDSSGRPRRGGVVVVTRDPTPSTWQAAVALGAERVVALPADDDALVAWLDDALGRGRAGRVVAVTGARGGAGASTLAVSLATTAAELHGSCCVVDADPLAGGIDLVLGDDLGDGVRWSDLATTDGRLAGEALRDALPRLAGVSVLTWSRGRAFDTSASTMCSVVAACRRAFSDVVVDVPRALSPASREVLDVADLVILVVPDDVRSVAAAGARIPALLDGAAAVGVVVRSTSAGGIPAEQLAAGVGLPLLGIVPTRRSIARRIEDGLGPPRRGVFRRRCRSILDGLGTPGPGTSSSRPDQATVGSP